MRENCCSPCENTELERKGLDRPTKDRVTTTKRPYPISKEFQGSTEGQTGARIAARDARAVPHRLVQ